MPLTTQAKLLRAVQSQTITRVGSLTGRQVNVRIIAATHKDIPQAIRDGLFREDLYYRLSMVEIAAPSLRDRADDLPLLIRHFVQRFSQEYGKAIHGVTPRAMILLERYAWPGNVRELEHAIGHACMMTSNNMLDVQELPARLLRVSDQEMIREGETSGGGAFPPAEKATPADAGIFGLATQERELVVRALAETHGNQSQAARRLGIGRDALRYKMKKHGLEDVAKARSLN